MTAADSTRLDSFDLSPTRNAMRHHHAYLVMTKQAQVAKCLNYIKSTLINFKLNLMALAKPLPTATVP